MKSAATTTLQVSDEDGKSDVPITRVLNWIIHHKELEVHRTDLLLQAAARFIQAGKIDPMAVFNIKSKPVPAFCCVVSDKGQGAIFRIQDFIEIFVKEILPNIIECCEAQGLYFDDPLED